ncbi:methionine adenosyltransferase [Methylomagnum ishizawai]|uniref:methionine adenosyltransferase n=1 Tax=Methylomagnum ishizawai TaxID=1760988 RepID=UPI001C3332F8|nr:methionine adenosyltransferase [Methylomagnum ishizawai]BBL73030.1 S-adenosylmethionine synthase [Methylomagnum ishizawai]
MRKSFLFTSESVAEGHPDRVCDTIADAIVDRFLQQDPYSHVVTECALSKGLVFVAARFASKATVDIPELARQVVGEVGYRKEGFNASECTVVTSLTAQPLEQRYAWDERQLSDKELDRIEVRNQTTQFGFACNQTPEFMPLPIAMANRLARQLRTARESKAIPYLSPDCTTQVGVEFVEGVPQRIHSITLIVGQQGKVQVEPANLRNDLLKHVVGPVFAGIAVKPDEATDVFVNPRGGFAKSGPVAHSGMTGRKTASDTYGGYARHAGSALSGKDPCRMDRVGAYAARYAAKNVVAAGLAEECEVQLSYTIGQARPVSIEVRTFGTGTVAEDLIESRLAECIDFRLGAIIRDFDLRHLPSKHKGGFYARLPVNGHFGASFTELPWEKLDKAQQLR